MILYIILHRPLLIFPVLHMHYQQNFVLIFYPLLLQLQYLIICIDDKVQRIELNHQLQVLQYEFREIHIEELAIGDLIQFFEPYRQYILSGTEAEAAMDRISKQNSADSAYA